jgi:hypothetical protein
VSLNVRGGLMVGMISSGALGTQRLREIRRRLARTEERYARRVAARSQRAPAETLAAVRRDLIHKLEQELDRESGGQASDALANRRVGPRDQLLSPRRRQSKG